MYTLPSQPMAARPTTPLLYYNKALDGASSCCLSARAPPQQQQQLQLGLGAPRCASAAASRARLLGEGNADKPALATGDGGCVGAGAHACDALLPASRARADARVAAAPPMLPALAQPFGAAAPPPTHTSSAARAAPASATTPAAAAGEQHAWRADAPGHRCEPPPPRPQTSRPYLHGPPADDAEARALAVEEASLREALATLQYAQRRQEEQQLLLSRGWAALYEAEERYHEEEVPSYAATIAAHARRCASLRAHLAECEGRLAGAEREAQRWQPARQRRENARALAARVRQAAEGVERRRRQCLQTSARYFDAEEGRASRARLLAHEARLQLDAAPSRQGARAAGDGGGRVTTAAPAARPGRSVSFACARRPDDEWRAASVVGGGAARDGRDDAAEMKRRRVEAAAA